jgi:hypothetical protein
MWEIFIMKYVFYLDLDCDKNKEQEKNTKKRYVIRILVWIFWTSLLTTGVKKILFANEQMLTINKVIN